MIYTTKTELKDAAACGANHTPPDERYSYLLTWAPEGDDEPISLLDILDRNGADDAIWALRACDGADDIARWLARWAAVTVNHRWDAPDIVVQYLRTGDETIRAAAGAAAGAAESAAARAACWAAAGAASRAAAGAAYWSASSAADWSAARAADRAACWAADRAAARAAARASSGNCLRRLLVGGIPDGDITDEMVSEYGREG